MNHVTMQLNVNSRPKATDIEYLNRTIKSQMNRCICTIFKLVMNEKLKKKKNQKYEHERFTYKYVNYETIYGRNKLRENKYKYK